MANYNEQDYKNALKVIEKCQEWTRNTIKNYAFNDDFPHYEKIMLLDDSQKNHYHRGGKTTFLSIDYNGLTAVDFCGDGTQWTHDIRYDANPYTYAYNNTHQGTIDIAVRLATDWSVIKERISNMISSYERNKNEAAEILAAFKV